MVSYQRTYTISRSLLIQIKIRSLVYVFLRIKFVYILLVMEKLVLLKEVFDLLFNDSEEEESDNDIRVIKTPFKKCRNYVGSAVANLPGHSSEHVPSSNHEDSVAVNGQVKTNKNYVEHIVPKMPDKSFKEHFRVEPEVFEIICKDIYPFLYKKYGPGRNALKLDKQVLMTLCYLGNNEALRSISDKFNVCTSTSWRIVSNVCNAILKLNEDTHIIKWPNRKEAENTSKHYCDIYNLQGVIGCIGSCLIKTRAPLTSKNSYKNKDRTHSIPLQAASNEKMEFIYYYVGECGSLDIASLMEKSELEYQINSGTYKITKDQHLLGDSAYQPRTWLITPYQENEGVELTDGQTFFNTMHSECLGDINRSFVLLKERFQRLHYIDSLTSSTIKKFIAVCCILHNICLKNSDISEEGIEYQVDEYENVSHRNKYETEAVTCKRDLLMNLLYE
ncbi:putative nuclease HARBI1 isoform X2 [Bactrocera tryoni]|uniref:putative nuclease HARBI1 isoform X2 n=2 Tax=Bactrocera tyroni species complex TaxID=98808 RepID=UPI001A9733E8|nr:putative nuclease HARBI1 isoform X2 [Bactrocera tryoni]